MMRVNSVGVLIDGPDWFHSPQHDEMGVWEEAVVAVDLLRDQYGTYHPLK